MKYKNAKEHALSILREDKEKRGGFSHYPKTRLKQESGINEPDLLDLQVMGCIEFRNANQGVVITYLHDKYIK